MLLYQKCTLKGETDQAYFDVMRTQKKMAYGLGVKTWQEEGAYTNSEK